MRLTFLGTGTSTGVPMIGCHCRTCSSKDPADHRLRASVLLQPDDNTPGILIDAGPDLRTQLLACDSPLLAAVLITHIHYDHVGGIDDLRPYCYNAPGKRFPVYCREDVAQGLRHNVPYAFAANHYPGAPTFDLRIVDAGKAFTVPCGKDGIEVTAIEVIHGKLPILGYRIGRVAYITDASDIADSSMALLSGVDTLVINALRPAPHPAHFSLEQSIEIISRLRPRVAYLTHMSHDMPPAVEVEALLPRNVYLAHDNETLII